jgi:histone demethylase JARID1
LEISKIKETTLQWLAKAEKVRFRSLLQFVSQDGNNSIDSPDYVMIQVACDSGELALDLVYGLIAEGENLSVHFEKELKVHAPI